MGIATYHKAMYMQMVSGDQFLNYLVSTHKEPETPSKENQAPSSEGPLLIWSLVVFAANTRRWLGIGPLSTPPDDSTSSARFSPPAFAGHLIGSPREVAGYPRRR